MLVKVIFLVLLASINVQSDTLGQWRVSDNLQFHTGQDNGHQSVRQDLNYDRTDKSNAPVLTAIPDRSVFTKGGSVRLVCSYPDSGGKQTSRLYFKDRVIVTNDISNTFINRDLQPAESGDYTCDVVPQAGTTPKSNVVSIQVIECPDGWDFVFDRCLITSDDDNFTFGEADLTCAEAGGRLVMPKTPDFYHAMLQWPKLMAIQSGAIFWIAIANQRAPDDSDYYWLDGQGTLVSSTWSNWGLDRPLSRPDRCVISSRDRVVWWDYKCSNKRALAICQKPGRDICTDRKPWACKAKVKGLNKDEKRKYCKKPWPSKKCMKTCGYKCP